MEKNYEAALKVIEGAQGICRENKDFAADIVRALAGEVKPEEMMFRVGDIVTHPIFGQGAIIEINSPNAIGDTITVEYFKGIGYYRFFIALDRPILYYIVITQRPFERIF